MTKLSYFLVISCLYSCLLIGCAKTPFETFNDALRENNLNKVEVALLDGLDKDKALLTATKKNSIQIVEYLLNSGANANSSVPADAFKDFYLVNKNNNKKYEISISIQNKQRLIRNLVPQNDKEYNELLKKPVDCLFEFSVEEKAGVNPLHYAIKNRNIDIVRLLISRGVKVSDGYISETAAIGSGSPLFSYYKISRQTATFNVNGTILIPNGSGKIVSNNLPIPQIETTSLLEAEKTGDLDILALIKSTSRND